MSGFCRPSAVGPGLVKGAKLPMVWLAERVTKAPTVSAPRAVPGEATRCELLSTKLVNFVQLALLFGSKPP